MSEAMATGGARYLLAWVPTGKSEMCHLATNGDRTLCYRPVVRMEDRELAPGELMCRICAKGRARGSISRAGGYGRARVALPADPMLAKLAELQRASVEMVELAARQKELDEKITSLRRDLEGFLAALPSAPKAAT